MLVNQIKKIKTMTLKTKSQGRRGVAECVCEGRWVGGGGGCSGEGVSVSVWCLPNINLMNCMIQKQAEKIQEHKNFEVKLSKSLTSRF